MPAVFLNILRMCLLALWVLLGGLAAAYAESASEPVSSGTVEKLQDRVIELEKETAVLKAKIDAQDYRIADGIGLQGAEVTKLSNQTSMLGNEISMLGVLVGGVTLLLAVSGTFGGLLAFKRAEQIAKEQSEKWFKDNVEDLHLKIENLDVFLKELKGEVIERKNRFFQELLASKESQAEISGEDFFPNDNSVSSMKHSEGFSDSCPSFQNVYFQGVEQASNKKYKEALDLFSTAIELLGDPPDRNLYAKALVSKGAMYDEMNLSSEAIGEYDKAIALSEFGGEAKLAYWSVIAMFNKAGVFTKCGEEREAIAIYDQLIDGYHDSDDPSVIEWVFKAMYSKGRRLAGLEKYEDAIDNYNQVIKRIGTITDPKSEFFEPLVKSFSDKGLALAKLKKFDEAKDAFDRAVRLCEQKGCSGLSDVFVSSAFLKAVALASLNRFDEAKHAFEYVVERFKDDESVGTKELVAQAKKLLNVVGSGSA